MSDDWEYDEAECPKCGHYPTRRVQCWEVGCDDGYIDLSEIDEDQFWYDPGDVEPCDMCNGFGVLRWCPECGHDLNAEEMERTHDQT